MSEQENLALARQMSQEMEEDGTWSQLKAQVARQHPRHEHERRFLMVRDDGNVAPALMLRGEPWTEEAAEHYMAYLWEHQRVGGFVVEVNPDGDTSKEDAFSLTLRNRPESEHPMGVALMFIVDLESGRFFQGKTERTPEEAAALALQHYLAVMLPPGAVQFGE